MSRDEFLARVRTAAAAGAAYRVDPQGTATTEGGYVGVSGDRCARLAAEVVAAGGEALVVDDLAAARKGLDEWLALDAPRSAVYWRHPLLEKLGLAELLAQRGVDAADGALLAALPPPQRRETLLAADLGITSADFAVAETGTLVVCSRAGQEPLASLLPPTHLAVVSADQIVADLFDLFAALAQRGHDTLPSNLVLITGPSKTGDIELTLTTGVHGPGRCRVIVVRTA
jgi:L-lactate utilization protein LutC